MLDKYKIMDYLALLSKEIKKELGRNAKVELVLVGGASILLNYDFRQTTLDIDAMKAQSLNIKDCIFRLADKYDLPDDWINFDFQKTTSFSPKLAERSTFFKTFNQILDVYTIKDAPLVCMKLIAFRDTKHDHNDIVGVLTNNNTITMEDVDKEMKYLYGNWERVSDDAVMFLKKFPLSKSETYQNLLKEREKVSLFDRIDNLKADVILEKPKIKNTDEWER